MPAPNSPCVPDGPGYYWAQQYYADLEELSDPMMVQVFVAKGQMQIAFLGLEQPFRIPTKWVWLSKVDVPERLEVDLG